MKQMFQGNNWQIGKFRWSVTNNKKPVNFGHPQNIAELLAVAPEQRDDKQKKALNDYYRTRMPACNNAPRPLRRPRNRFLPIHACKSFKPT